MYMMIHGSSFYNRLLAGECDSRWLSSNGATGWYESAHECLLVQLDIFLIKTLSCVCFHYPSTPPSQAKKSQHFGQDLPAFAAEI